MAERDGYSIGSVFFAFLLGGVLGAGIALMFAPQSGAETRKKIKSIADDAIEKSTEYTEEIKERITKGLEHGKGKLTLPIKEGKEFIEEKKSAVSSALEAGKEAYEQERAKHKKA